MKTRSALLLSSLLATLGLSAAGCSTPAEQKENALSASGFHQRPADTPARVASMKALPPNTFVTQVQKGRTVYLYADPAGCNCIYYGTEDNYGLYQQARYQQRMADEAARAPIPEDSYDFDYGLWGGPFFPY